MLHSTQGIVLGSVKYRDTSLIVKIFTEAFGTQSYIVNGVRSKRAKGKIALYQPLSLLDMVVYHRPDRDIQRISETKFAQSFTEIPFDELKRTIAIFITEFLAKVLREEGENKSLFQFLFHSIEHFDKQENAISNFHLQLLLKCSAFLGFKPQNAEDMIHQLEDQGFHTSLDKDQTNTIDLLLNSEYGFEVLLTNALRRDALDLILKFYRANTGTLGEIKSIEVLKALLTT